MQRLRRIDLPNCIQKKQIQDNEEVRERTDKALVAGKGASAQSSNSDEQTEELDKRLAERCWLLTLRVWNSAWRYQAKQKRCRKKRDYKGLRKTC
jgi:hypothetical protein